MKRLVSFFSICCFVFCIVVHLSFAGQLEDELAAIQKAIKEKGAKWTAGITSVARMPVSSQNKMLGVRGFSPGGGRSGLLLKASAAPLPPDSFDWRSKGKVTSVKKQGECGSCWAFAAMAVLESVIMIHGGPKVDLSEQYLVSCDTSNYGCAGGMLENAARFLKNTGAIPESCFPYVGSEVSCEKKCSDWSSKIRKISNWGWVSSNPKDIKQALYTHGPLYVGYTVYRDFFYYKSGIYEHVWGPEAGGHAVAMVGYDTKGQYWICKNSWGAGDWGEGGYFKMKWNSSDMENEVMWMDPVINK